MSLLRVAARRATPMVARAGRQQGRQASTGQPHFDPFAVDPNNKRQNFLWWVGVVGALAAPIFAVKYQLDKGRTDKRSFG